MNTVDAASTHVSSGLLCKNFLMWVYKLKLTELIWSNKGKIYGFLISLIWGWLVWAEYGPTRNERARGRKLYK